MTDPNPQAGLYPQVSVVIPARDAADTIERCIAAIEAQTYPGSIDITVALGPSKDRSAELLAELAKSTSLPLTVVDNPARSTPAGLNAAIRASAGDVVARVDAQSILPPTYIQRAVAAMDRTGAANVGGLQHPVADDGLQRIVAAAMRSSFGAGPAQFRRGSCEGPTDTVYLGVFDRRALTEVGGFDETLTRNQDYELNWRLRENGHVVWLDPDLVVDYTPRSTYRGLARQYFQYGAWKRSVLLKHPKSIRARQVIAPLLVAGLTLSALALALGHALGLVIPVAYVLACLVAAHSQRQALTALGDRLRAASVYATMHLSWGTGFWFGSARRRGRLQQAESASSPPTA